jgi:hypothetical protein
MAAVGLAALQAAGLFAAMRSAITLATITMAAEIEHRTAGREVTHALTLPAPLLRRTAGQPATIMAG